MKWRVDAWRFVVIAVSIFIAQLLADLNGGGVLVSANGTAVYAIPGNYQKLALEMSKIQQEEKERRLKEEANMKEKMKNYQSEDDFSEIEQMIYKFIFTKKEISPAAISRAIPRSVAPADVQEAMKKLEAIGAIRLNEFNNFVIAEK